MEITQDKFFSQAYTVSKAIQEHLVANSNIAIDEDCFCPDGFNLNDYLIQTYETRSSKITESIIKIAPTGKTVLAIAFNPSINSNEKDDDNWEDNVKRREEHNEKELENYKNFLGSDKSKRSRISYNKKWEYLSKSKKIVDENKKNIKVRERFENFDATRRNLLISILELFSKNNALKSKKLKEMIVADLIPFRTKKEKDAYTGSELDLEENFNNINELCDNVDVIIPCWGGGINSYFNKEYKDTREKFQESFESGIRPALDKHRDKIYFLNSKIKVRPIHPASQSGLSLIKLENNSDLILTL